MLTIALIWASPSAAAPALKDGQNIQRNTVPTYNDHFLSSSTSKSSSLQTDHGEKIAGGGGSLKVALGDVLSGEHPVVKRVEIDSQLPSLISLFIFVWSISETAVVSLYMGGLIVWRPSAQPKLAADHVSLWISPPLYMRMNLQCELGRCVHHIGGGVHFYVNLGQNCLHQNWGKCISRET